MPNTYWAERQARAQEKLTTKNIKQIEKQLRKYYGSAAKKVIADFEATYDKLLATIADGKDPTPADLYKLDKYWQLQAQVRQELQKLGERQVVALTKQFEIEFFDIYYAIDIVGDTAFNTLDTAIVTQLINQIWVADGKSWSQRIWQDSNLLLDTLNEELLKCVINGKRTTELKNMLQERFGVSYSRADTLAKTELAHIQTQAAKQRYEDAGVKEIEVWASKDERRCDICGNLHQKRFSIYETVPIPAHPRCRCCVIPVVEVD